MTGNHRFEGYQWQALSDIYPDENHGWRCMVQSFFDNIDWNALSRFAPKLNNGNECVFDSRWTIGGRHLVRMVNFQNGSRWIARLRMTSNWSEDEQGTLVQGEVDCLKLVKERTTVPVPTVFGYSTSTHNEIGAPFILMECLPGNCGLDLHRDIDEPVPPRYRSSFYAEMARLQVCSS